VTEEGEMDDNERKEIIENLKRLKAETDRILKELDPKDFPGDCVNWGSLRCFSVEYAIDDDGDEWHTVFIEEAGPEGCEVFRGEVVRRLEGLGWSYTRVVTEW
jgi:hypothetical protein